MARTVRRASHYTAYACTVAFTSTYHYLSLFYLLTYSSACLPVRTVSSSVLFYLHLSTPATFRLFAADGHCRGSFISPSAGCSTPAHALYCLHSYTQRFLLATCFAFWYPYSLEHRMPATNSRSATADMFSFHLCCVCISSAARRWTFGQAGVESTAPAASPHHPPATSTTLLITRLYTPCLHLLLPLPASSACRKWLSLPPASYNPTPPTCHASASPISIQLLLRFMPFSPLPLCL